MCATFRLCLGIECRPFARNHACLSAFIHCRGAVRPPGSCEFLWSRSDFDLVLNLPPHPIQENSGRRQHLFQYPSVKVLTAPMNSSIPIHPDQRFTCGTSLWQDIFKDCPVISLPARLDESTARRGQFNGRERTKSRRGFQLEFYSRVATLTHASFVSVLGRDHVRCGFE